MTGREASGTGEWARGLLAGPVARAAPMLLGAQVWCNGVSVEITEVEAYGGPEDPGSHARRGPTPRSRIMFGRAGTAYVYLSYGVHHCLNVVAGPVGTGAAVLIRAGRVVDGTSTARQRRTSSQRRRRTPLPDHRLASGPGALGQALGIELSHNGADLLVAKSDSTDLTLRLGAPTGEGGSEASATSEQRRTRAGARVGVAGPGGDGDTFPWRFWIADDLTVSRYRRATPRARSSTGPGTAG